MLAWQLMFVTLIVSRRGLKVIRGGCICCFNVFQNSPTGIDAVRIQHTAQNNFRRYECLNKTVAKE
jgi:hypothetical protein